MRQTAYAVACCGLLCLLAGAALAQDQPQQGNDLRPLLDRIDRLERDMNLLQRQVYRGAGPGGAPMAPSPTDGQSALNYEVRISQIEDQLRSVTGQIEQINYTLDQLKHRLDTLSSDVDQRLTALEHGGTAPAQTPPSAPPPGGPRPLGGSPPANAPGPGGQPHILGQIPAGAGQSAAAGAGAGAVNLPAGTPQQQYDAAFKLLRQANYPAAETALRAFIQRYPKDPLAGNAQYWLGETYFVRKDYTNAAAVFADGYQKYPKGGKAADNLLKLGMSLAQLGQKANACQAFARLERDFPTAPASIKERAGEEKKRLSCG